MTARLALPNKCIEAMSRFLEAVSTMATKIGRVPNEPGAAPTLVALTDVLPVNASRTSGNLLLVIPSVELYDGGFLVHAQLHYQRPSYDGVPELIFEASDDRAGTYRCWSGGGYGGGSQVGQMWRRDYLFRPGVDPMASELRLSVPRVEWQRPDPATHRLVVDETLVVDWEVRVPVLRG